MTRLLLLVLETALLAHAAEAIRLEGSRVTVTFDPQMRRHVEWKGAAAPGILVSDPAAQEGVVVSGVEIRAFQVDSARTTQKRIDDHEFGPAIEAAIAGISTEPGFKIERTVRVLLPDKYPDAVLFESAYRNLELRPVHLDRVYSQRVLLDRSLAEPRQAPYAFVSYQGGAYKWGTDYALIRLTPEFRQSNFQGGDDVNGPEGVIGGMPFVDAWSPTMGVALAHLAKEPQWLSLPVEVRPDRRVEMAITEEPLARFGQQEWLKPGETFRTVLTCVILHRLDYFDPLKIYGRLLRARGVAIPENSQPSAYEPYWKSWGWERNFTLSGMLDVLPELKTMGIHIANLDDGWYDYMGDWDLNRAKGKFTNGEPDMIDFVRKIHQQGFKTSLWWYPLGVDQKSRTARERNDLLVQAENGSYPLDNSDLHQFCPAYAPSLAYIREVLTRILSVWNFDGVYTDFQGLSGVPACFNKAHKHASPLDSFRSMPKLYEMIYQTLHKLKKNPDHEVCICSFPHSPYYMPYYNIANASDPVTTLQVRSRVKAEKAIRGGTFAVGDCYQVPMHEWAGSSVPESFESAIGTGAQLTTFYKRLDGSQRALWNRWFHEYRTLGLAKSEYVNLYDLAFDRPEVHVVRKGEEMYYGIFANVWPRTRRIELRGLDRNVIYEVYDYVNRASLGEVRGSAPYLRIGFKDSLLVRVRPVKGAAAAKPIE